MELKKIQSKQAFLTRNFIIAAILFSGVFALFTAGIIGVADNYQNTDIINEEIASNYNKLTETTDKVELARGTTTTGEGLGFRGTFDVAFAATFTVIQLVFSTLDLYGTVAGSFAGDFGVPTQIVAIFFTIILSILTVIIVWNWLSSISRGKI